MRISFSVSGNCEEIKGYLHLDEYWFTLIWSLKNETMNLEEYFTHKIKACKTDFHNLVQDLEPEIGSKMSCINQQLQLKLDNYFETSVNKEVIEQWKRRYTTSLQDACIDAKNKILGDMYRHSNLRSKLYNDKLRFEDFIMNSLDQTAHDLKLRDRGMSVEEIDSYFEGKWQESFSICFSFSKEEEAHETVFKAIEKELYSMFHQHNELLVIELKNRDSNSKDNNFDNYLDVLEYDGGDKKHSIMKKLRGSFKLSKTDIFREYQCFKFIQDNCYTIFIKVKQFVREMVGPDFQTGYATKVMQIIKECFNDVEKRGELLHFTFSIQLRIRIAVYISSCAANEFVKLRNKFMEETIRSVDVLTFKAFALDKFKLAYYGTTPQTQPTQDMYKRGTGSGCARCPWLD